MFPTRPGRGKEKIERNVRGLRKIILNLRGIEAKKCQACL